jgi:hypothetical protein
MCHNIYISVLMVFSLRNCVNIWHRAVKSIATHRFRNTVINLTNRLEYSSIIGQNFPVLSRTLFRSATL